MTTRADVIVVELLHVVGCFVDYGLKVFHLVFGLTFVVGNCCLVLEHKLHGEVFHTCLVSHGNDDLLDDVVL